MEYGLVLVWLVTFLALTAVGMPIAAWLFPRLDGRGAAFALPVALALLWLVAYLVGHISLTVGLWVGLLVVVGVAVAAVYRGVTFDRRRYGEVALVFTLTFALLVAIRIVDPAVHPGGGEKFLDFGLLRSILRADTLPPEDMWFAGQPVKYYYGGHLLAGLLTRITGTDPRFAYNLALAGFYGMLVTAAYGLAGSIAASRNLSRVRAGAFGAFFVGFASNLTTIGRFVIWLLPDGVSGTAAGVLGLEVKRLAEGGPTDFHYWTASRVIEGTINEFPLFAWLNGDLHAHMMSAPFVLLTAAVLFSYYRTPGEAVWRRRALVVGVVPVLAAMLAVVNTWSFATVGGLTLLALAFAPSDPVSLLPTNAAARLRRETWLGREFSRHGLALGGAVVVVVLGVLWSLPFWLTAASGGSRTVAFFPDRSSMMELLAVHGAFLLLFVLYLFRHALARITDDHAPRVAIMLGVSVLLVWVAGAAALALLGPVIAIAWLLLRSDGLALSHVTDRVGSSAGAVSNGGRSSSETAVSGGGTVKRLRDALGYETLLVVAGAGIVVLVEFVYVSEQAGPGRMNTVFKTYADVWVLWAVAAGAILTHLLDNHSPNLALSGGRWRPFMQGLAVVLVISTSMYGAFALGGHFAPGPDESAVSQFDDGTLDALQFAKERHPNEYQAIEYLSGVEGSPNMVSAAGRPMYRWSSPIASLSGVPTLVGWRHEIGYRGTDPYFARVGDVETIYTGPLERRAYLLDVYDVEYVYVGSNERTEYGANPVSKIADVEGVSLLKQWGSVRLYAVDQSKLTYSGQSDS
jgi:YYY domain-containing protein